MKFFNPYLDKIYKYIYIHDGQTLLLKDIAKDLSITQPTARKYIKWLARRDLIKKVGKKYYIIPT